MPANSSKQPTNPKTPSTSRSSSTASVPKKPGRPSLYSEELAAVICERLAQGESLRAICRDAGMPDVKTVMRWLATDPTFRQQYAHARELQTEAMLEDIIEIADDSSGDQLMGMPNSTAVARARLQVDARKWAMSKLAPKKYGDHQRIEMEAKVETASTVDLTKLSVEELRLLLDLQQKASVEEASS